MFAGNILLWSLTNVDNETNYELHIELEDWSGNKRFARYRGFRVGSERDAYRLYHANVYFGNAGELPLSTHPSPPAIGYCKSLRTYFACTSITPMSFGVT